MGDLNSARIASAVVPRVFPTTLRAAIKSCQRAGILPEFAIFPTLYGKDP
jgi:hypothetical protein